MVTSGFETHELFYNLVGIVRDCIELFWFVFLFLFIHFKIVVVTVDYPY